MELVNPALLLLLLLTLLLMITLIAQTFAADFTPIAQTCAADIHICCRCLHSVPALWFCYCHLDMQLMQLSFTAEDTTPSADAATFSGYFLLQKLGLSPAAAYSSYRRCYSGLLLILLLSTSADATTFLLLLVQVVSQVFC